MKNMIKLIGGVSVFLALCFIGGLNAYASDEELRLLQSKLQELKELNAELDKANMGYSTAQIELQTAQGKLGRLKSQVEVERETLDDLSQMLHGSHHNLHSLEVKYMDCLWNVHES